jgi:hypothetical protein
MSFVIRQHLGGNISPISSFTQNTRNISGPHLKKNSTSSPKGFKLKAETLAEVQVITNTFRFSFGRTVKEFLNRKEFISEDAISNVKSSAQDSLLKGVVHFQGKVL